MKVYVWSMMLLALASGAEAQTVALATTNAPVYVAATATTPMRVATAGTRFTVLEDADAEFVRVEFTDPVWGRRVGYVQRAHLKIGNAALAPMDLSAVPQEPVQYPMAPQPFPTKRRMPVFTNHLVGRSGSTFGTRPSMLVGFEGSVDVLPMLQAYGSFDWHQDAAPTYFDVVQDVTSWLVDADVKLKTPALVGMGGVKVIAPTRRVRPYGLGGFGLAHSKMTIRVDGTDLTDEVSPFLSDDLKGYTKPMFEVGGGLIVPVGAFYFDAGYKFRKAIQQDDINMSGVYVGMGFSY